MIKSNKGSVKIEGTITEMWTDLKNIIQVFKDEGVLSEEMLMYMYKAPRPNMVDKESIKGKVKLDWEDINKEINKTMKGI